MKVLKSKSTLAEIEDDMRVHARARERAALQGYLRFVRQHRSAAAVQPAAAALFGSGAPREMQWPMWRLAKQSDSLLHPTAENIRTTITEYYAVHKPMLLGDLVRRSPGRGISSDGTFRLMLRTRTEGQVLACSCQHAHVH